MFTVSIVDRQQSRRQSLTAFFKDANCTIREFGLYDELVEHSPDLLLIHFRDGEKNIDVVKRSVAVYYGGGGESDDPDWINRKDTRQECHRIWRAVMPDGKGSLTKDEAKELFSYVKDVIAGKADRSIPLFLEPPRHPNIITALAILCQGYLAVHSPETYKLDKEFWQQKGNVQKTTTTTQWWMDSLCNRSTADLSKVDFWSALKDLKKLVNKEWEVSRVLSFAPVLTLLDSIELGEGPDMMVEKAKNALETIREFLDEQTG
ncbi:MAG: hypothetical protein JJE30_11135 [Desulfuromonadales bacterium]|nr:hypothetical protein [Desulfuromonadales bacterium]